MRLSDFKRRAQLRRMAQGVLRPKRYTKRGGKGALRGFTAQQSKSIRAAINRTEETKYYAKQLAQNTLVDAGIHTPGTDILPLVPAIPKSLNEFGRAGRSVRPTKCRVDVSLTYPDVNAGSTLPSGLHNAAQIYAVMYIVRSKVIKNWDAFVGSSEYTNLLDDGNGNAAPFGYIVNAGTGSAFWTANTTHLQYPVESSHYTLLKKKVVKLTRNNGGMFLGDGATQNLPSSTWRGSFSYKLPTLQYDDSPIASPLAYPTNTNVMLMVGYAFANNLDALSVTGGDPPYAPFTVPQLLSWTVRSHVWYKDA